MRLDPNSKEEIGLSNIVYLSRSGWLFKLMRAGLIETLGRIWLEILGKISFT